MPIDLSVCATSSAAAPTRTPTLSAPTGAHLPHLETALLTWEPPSIFGRCTMLMLACDRPDSALTRFLLDHGADPNRAKTNGSTALYKAPTPPPDSPVDLLMSTWIS